MDAASEMSTSFFFYFLPVFAELALAYDAPSPGVLDPLFDVAPCVDECLGGADAESYDSKDCQGCKVRNDASVPRCPNHNIFQHLFLILTLY